MLLLPQTALQGLEQTIVCLLLSMVAADSGVAGLGYPVPHGCSLPLTASQLAARGPKHYIMGAGSCWRARFSSLHTSTHVELCAPMIVLWHMD
jgi:hypothetical protein